ncbi:MAG: hypothetical protein ACRDZ4_07235 [Egibacteraceae bacterium]
MSFLTRIHGSEIAFALIGIWAVIGLWSLALRFMKYEETPTFWRVVSVAQILLAVQWLVGLVLLLMGGRPGRANAGPKALLLHLLYAVFSPVVVLGVAHFMARKGTQDGRRNPYTTFALVGLVMFGLLFRAYQVGIYGR